MLKERKCSCQTIELNVLKELCLGLQIPKTGIIRTVWHISLINHSNYPDTSFYKPTTVDLIFQQTETANALNIYQIS